MSEEVREVVLRLAFGFTPLAWVDWEDPGREIEVWDALELKRFARASRDREREGARSEVVDSPSVPARFGLSSVDVERACACKKRGGEEAEVTERFVEPDPEVVLRCRV